MKPTEESIKTAINTLEAAGYEVIEPKGDGSEPPNLFEEFKTNMETKTPKELEEFWEKFHSHRKDGPSAVDVVKQWEGTSRVESKNRIKELKGEEVIEILFEVQDGKLSPNQAYKKMFPIHCGNHKTTSITEMEVIQINTDTDGDMNATISYRDESDMHNDLNNGYRTAYRVPINTRPLQLSVRDNPLVDQSVKHNVDVKPSKS